MSNKRLATLSFSVAVALAGLVAVLWLPVLSKVEGLGGSQVALAQSGSGIIRVATTGSDTPGCGSQATPCRMVQYAVDEAQAGEEIRVAAGLYTDLHGRAAPGDYLSPPASGVITQVVYVSKTVTIRGGYTTAFSDPPDPETNQTTLDAQGGGRVLFIADPSAGSGQAISPTVEGLRLTNGDAAGLGGATDDAGGGVYVINATATISNNWVFSNTASYRGGGLYLGGSDAILSGNTVTDNTADYGGGLYLHGSDATLSGNTISTNTANTSGGGLSLRVSNATLSGNTVTANTAADYSGGGLALVSSDDATLSGNTIISNTANQYGGGLFLNYSDVTLTNNVIADNQASSSGSGLYIRQSSVRLLHTTIARNGSSGALVIDVGSTYSTVALTNTILVSHTVGIDVAAGNTATLESTLWYNNTTAWSGNVIRSNDYTGEALFDADGYHLLAGSAAVDRGVNAGVTTDIDGDPRPQGSAPELGADEIAPTSAPGGNIYLPSILKNH